MQQRKSSDKNIDNKINDKNCDNKFDKLSTPGLMQQQKIAK